MAQPDLDFMAPEIQVDMVKCAGALADMFSLGMVICTVHNKGKPLIQTNHNPNVYTKQLEQV